MYTRLQTNDSLEELSSDYKFLHYWSPDSTPHKIAFWTIK